MKGLTKDDLHSMERTVSDLSKILDPNIHLVMLLDPEEPSPFYGKKPKVRVVIAYYCDICSNVIVDCTDAITLIKEIVAAIEKNKVLSNEEHNS